MTSHPSTATTLLLMAKLPVAGRVKTRLAADLARGGVDAARAATLAAAVARAALLDTIDAATAAFGADRCRLALDGDPAQLRDLHEVDAELASELHGWRIDPQHGDSFGERLAHAHASVGGRVVQIGMDTPQATPKALRAVDAALDHHQAVLGPALDGGWWVLGLRDGAGAAGLAQVPMSTPTVHRDTRRVLTDAGLDVGEAAPLLDVDHLHDARVVADLVPGSRFAAAVSALPPTRTDHQPEPQPASSGAGGHIR